MADHEERARGAGMPTWLPDAAKMITRRLAVAIVVAVIALLAILAILGRLQNLIGMLLMALFLSFALEPAVGYLSHRRGMRRGAATGLMFLAVFLGIGLILALVIPAIISGVTQLYNNAPALVARLADWLRPFKIELSQETIVKEIQNNAQTLASHLPDVAGGVLGITSKVLGGLFRWATIALFTFYIVAEGPKLRRTLCSMLPPAYQQRVLFVWEQAIDQTGGYFYSRLLLAIINGTGMYITLRVFQVPFAAPLAVFEGVVAEFIPIVGTYIAGAPPILVALLSSTTAGIAALAYVLVYQQLENYFLSPRLTARTMSLHPAIAFAAALIGGALGGLLMAFLALPVAGVAQAAVKAWGRRYDVVADQLTAEPAPRAQRSGLVERIRDEIGDSGSDDDARG
jgi:predicted PurR-regulated permease PerM